MLSLHFIYYGVLDVCTYLFDSNLKGGKFKTNIVKFVLFIVFVF